MTMAIEILQLTSPTGGTHTIFIGLACGSERAALTAEYRDGPLLLSESKKIAEWSASYEPPFGVGTGHVHIGDGRIDIQIPELRGIGLGSLLMQPLIRWMQSRPHVVDVAPINLSSDDAQTDDALNRRNIFYEKLGFRFDYGDSRKSYGESYPMKSSALVLPKFRLSNGWAAVSLANEGGPIFV